MEPHWRCPHCGPVEPNLDAPQTCCAKCGQVLRPGDFITPLLQPSTTPLSFELAHAAFDRIRALVDAAPDFKSQH